MNTREDLIEKAKKIKLLLLDVDGVLTDGRIVYDSRGRDLKFFDVQDGLGVYLLKRCGIPTILITAKGSRAIKPRAQDMQVEQVFTDVSSKSEVLEKILKRYKITNSEACFVGDDLVDLGIMHKVGFAVAVANACAQVKECSDYITHKPGGRGAVREVIELILESQERWQEMLALYSR